MPVLNIAMVGSDALATEIAKSTETRDVQTYVHKEMNGDEQNILSIIRPVKYPDKLRPFLSALSVAEVGMIEIEALDKYFGEILIAFASSGITIFSPLAILLRKLVLIFFFNNSTTETVSVEGFH